MGAAGSLMGRKNIFDDADAPAASPSPAPAPAPAAPKARKTAEPFNFGPVQALRNDLRDMEHRTVREIDPALIEGYGHRDRLKIDDEDIAELRESIKAHGQQVPILVRPHPTAVDRYQVIYGRRRLEALRGLGIPAKAIVRKLDETEAIIAQGQENNLRRDPSFIEKAVFASQLLAEDYSSEIVKAALGVDKAMLSRLVSVGQAFPIEVIEAIGPAPESGRRPWLEFVGLIKEHEVEPLDLLRKVLPNGFGPGLSSDQRLILFRELAESHLTGQPPMNDKATSPDARTRVAPATVTTPSAKPAVAKLSLRDGRRLADMRRDKKALTLKIPLGEQAEFGQWLEENAETALRRLHREWAEETGSE